MTAQELQAIGLTPNDVLDRLVEKLVEHYVESEDGYKNDFVNRIEAGVKQAVEARIESALTVHVFPKVKEMIEGICLQETNRWGEKVKGEKLTFIEYLTQRVDAYIREEVNHDGKTQGQDSYSWTKHSTRIAYLIHEHLQYSIERAMVEALGNVNSSVRQGLAEAVKIALASIKVEVNTKVKT